MFINTQNDYDFATNLTMRNIIGVSDTLTEKTDNSYGVITRQDNIHSDRGLAELLSATEILEPSVTANAEEQVKAWYCQAVQEETCNMRDFFLLLYLRGVADGKKNIACEQCAVSEHI